MVMFGFFPSHLSVCVCVCALMLLFFKPMKLTFWIFFAWIWANRKMSMFSMFTGTCAIRHWSIEINAYVDCWRNYVPSCQCCKRTKIIRTKNQKKNFGLQLCTMYYRFACVQMCLYAALFFFVSSIFLSLRLRQTSTNCCYRALLATWLYMGFLSVKSYGSGIIRYTYLFIIRKICWDILRIVLFRICDVLNSPNFCILLFRIFPFDYFNDFFKVNLYSYFFETPFIFSRCL